jgi:hypothetical protein
MLPSVALTRTAQSRLEGLVAHHKQAKAQLTNDQTAELDRLCAAIRKEIFSRAAPRDLLDAVIQTVNRLVPILTRAEARAFAVYALNEIAAGSTDIGSQGSAAAGSNPIGAASSGGGQDQLLAATQNMQETQMSFNLQYLELQSQMQNENRSYTAISNIMKTKHDTVQNSIANIR